MRLKAALARALARRLRPILVTHADPVIRDALADRRQAWIVVHAELDALRGPLHTLEATARACAPQFDRRPLGPELTVHAAHARDPRVQAIFARHGLPDCPTCPVGADETLGEAAFSEGFDANQLIAEIAAVLAT